MIKNLSVSNQVGFVRHKNGGASLERERCVIQNKMVYKWELCPLRWKRATTCTTTSCELLPEVIPRDGDRPKSFLPGQHKVILWQKVLKKQQQQRCQ